MSWTKRQLITQAFAEVGLAEYVFDLSTEQLQNALTRLDGMMAVWNGKGIFLGYPLPNTQAQSSLEQDSNLPNWAYEAVYLNLAIRLAPGFGKTISPDTKLNAKLALDAVMAQNAMPVEMQFPDTMPSGAGNKPWRTIDAPFLGPPVDPILAGQGGPLEFN